MKFWVSAAPPYVRRPAAPSVIEDEVRCVRCGADLRRQDTHGRCPGCDAPVWFSIYGNWLRAAAPEWLSRVRLGVAFWIWTFAVVLLLNLLGFVGQMVVAAFADDPLQANTDFLEALSLGGLLATALELAAVFLITAQEPSAAAAERRLTLRRGLRVLVLIGLLGPAVHIVRLGLRSEAFSRLLFVFANVGSVLGLIHVAIVAGLLLYLRRLARRIPDRRLEKHTTIVCWGLCLTLGAWAVMSVALTAAGWVDVGLPTPPPRGACVLSLPLAAALVLTVWLVVLLARYRRAIGTAIETITVETADR